MDEFINNYSDIQALLNEKFIQKIINDINNNTYVNITTKLIHKKEKLTMYEQFIFNLDNYITFIKEKLLLNPLQLRYIILLTVNNKFNKILTNKIYYYENIELYNQEFIKLFMYNYKKNIKYLKKYLNIKELEFEELVKKLNKQNKKAFIYFEKINASNINYYLPIIEYLENIN